ncbi:hypothetical protein V5O48_016889, partial [Marasmius crinis-equi]
NSLSTTNSTSLLLVETAKNIIPSQRKHTRARANDFFAAFQQLPYPRDPPTPLDPRLMQSITTSRQATSRSSEEPPSRIPQYTGISSSRRNSSLSSTHHKSPKSQDSRETSLSSTPAQQGSTPSSSASTSHRNLFGATSTPSGSDLKSEMDASWRKPARKRWVGNRPTTSNDGDDNLVFSTPSPSPNVLSTSSTDSNPTIRRFEEPSSSSIDRHELGRTPSVDSSSREQSISSSNVTSFKAQAIDSVESNHNTLNSLEIIRLAHAQLREMYVMYYFRKQGLERHSMSTIDEQPIGITGDFVYALYAQSNPNVIQPALPVSTKEKEFIRKNYPEPYGKHHSRRYRANRGRGGKSLGYSQGVKRGYQTATGHADPEPSDNESDSSKTSRGNRSGNNNSYGSSQKSQQGRENDPNLSGDGPPGEPPGGGPPDGGNGDSDGYESESSSNGDPWRNPLQFPSDYPNNLELGKPVIFGETRFSSADRTFNEKEEYTYNPTPQSEEEILRAAFRTYEDLIIFHLHGAPTNGDNNIQKTIIQSIPKPNFYYGDNSNFVTFDLWICALIQWLNIADQCGPEYVWRKSRRRWVQSAVDIQRCNTLAAFLRAAALQWFMDEIDRVPNDFDRSDPMKGRRTFMQIVSGLYGRFIHEASLTRVRGKFNHVRYNSSSGIKGVFSALKRYAFCMPSPPDLYSFKSRLMILVPKLMEHNMLHVHKVSAESLHKEKEKRQNSRSPSPGRLQKVEGRRYSVKPHSQPDNRRPDWPNKIDNYKRNSRDKYNSNDKGKSREGEYKPSGRFFRAVDQKGTGNDRQFQMVEVPAPDGGKSPNSEPELPSDNEVISRYDNNNSESDDNSSESNRDPWGGSQYLEDAADDEYFGFMREHGNEQTYERLAFTREMSDSESDSVGDQFSEILQLDYGEYLRTMRLDISGGGYATLEPKGAKAPKMGTRPRRTAAENRHLSAFIELDGVKAFVLFDSRSTADAISPDFARQSGIWIFQLENPVTLQLGTKDSRSKINHGCVCSYQFRTKSKTIHSKDYFDIANVDRYDAIVGTVFMRKHGISVHFEDDSIRMKGQRIPFLSEGEEVQELARRYAKQVTRVELRNNEELEVRKRPKKYGVVKHSPKDKLSQNSK